MAADWWNRGMGIAVTDNGGVRLVPPQVPSESFPFLLGQPNRQGRLSDSEPRGLKSRPRGGEVEWLVGTVLKFDCGW